MRALDAIGIESYDSYVVDGHSEYLGRDGRKVVSPPAHEQLTIGAAADREGFLGHLKLHEERRTTYLEMSRGLAASGVEKWTVDTRAATMTFYDRAGNQLLVRRIE